MKDIKIKHEIHKYKLNVSHKELLFIREGLLKLKTNNLSTDKINSMLFDCEEISNISDVKDLVKDMVKKMDIVDHVNPY